MGGFRSIGEYVDACEGGKNWITGFRKAVPSSVSTWLWFDISSGVGTYVPNYFASSPLTASHMPYNKGLFVPDTGTRKYIKDFTCMLTAASATSTASDTTKYHLCDFLLYYPFVDMTLAGSTQELDNAVTLPRFVDGEGVRIMMVAQSAGGVATGNLSISYTNTRDEQRTVTGRVNGTYILGSGNVIAPVMSGIGGEYGFPFVPLALGDSGVKAINSITLAGDFGGLVCLVLVKPLLTGYVGQGCRRTTTGNLDSFGSPSQMTNIIHQTTGAWVEDGAYVTPLLSCGASGAGSSLLVGTLETVWN